MVLFAANGIGIFGIFEGGLGRFSQKNPRKLKMYKLRGGRVDSKFIHLTATTTLPGYVT